MSFREKLEELQALGIDRVLVVRFNHKMRNMEAVEFIERVFVRGLAAKHIVVGDDLRFLRLAPLSIHASMLGDAGLPCGLGGALPRNSAENRCSE